MQKYDFNLKFSLGQHDADPESFIENLLAEGCDDALIGVGKPGRISLNFTREAASADEAVFSALSAVQRSIPGAELIEAAPDLVGLTDIAQLLGFSRQNMRKLTVGTGSAFPPPVHEGKPAIWHLATVLSWFVERKNRHFDQALFDISQISMQCNLARDTALLDREIAVRLKQLIS